jgi:hypothetical protein
MEPTGTVKVQTPEDLAAKFPKPNPKATATDYTKWLVKNFGGDLTPDEMAALVKHHYPNSTTSAQGILHHYAALKVSPKGGLPTDYQYTPVIKPAPKVPPLPKPAKVPANASDVILAQKIGEQAGSNPGGMYLGSDGKQRYVKFYADETQAYCEHVSNEIYRLLGQNAPTSTLFDNGGKLAYASDIMAIEGTVATQGLTKEVADQILKGFAADILTANWDAVGMSFDNVVILKGGGIARIDQGGTLLFRATAGMKPASVLKDIAEWSGFAPGGLNPQYASVFKAAGHEAAEDLGKDLVAQVKQIEKLRAKLGGWESFVKSRTPGLDPVIQAHISDMLEARTDLLIAKAKLVAHPPKPAKVPVYKPGKPIDPKALTPRPLSYDEGSAKRKQLYSSVFPTFKKTELDALRDYKGNGYYKWNDYLRTTPRVYPNSEFDRKTVLIKSLFRKSVATDEDLHLWRGVHLQKWADLTNANAGEILHDDSFISMSNMERTSQNFAGYGPDGVMLHIKVARGTKLIPCRNPLEGDSESEFLGDHCRYRVLSVKGHNPTYIEVELIETQEGGATWNRKIK